MPDHTTQLDDLQLIALPSAVSCTGLFVQFTLAEWRLKPVVDTTTDAAKHLVRSVVDVVDTVGENSPPVPITVRLRLRGQSLTVEVEVDRSVPKLAVPSALASTTSGVSMLPNGRQLIWYELPLPGGMHATAVALPRRGTTKAARVELHPEAEAPSVDVDVMQRILSSLNRKAHE